MRPSSPARPDAIRRHNLSVMLGHVHRDGALTRAELTQRLAVSRSTVGALVADLTQLGLVQELIPSGGAGVGRPSHVVGPHHGGPYVVAVDLDVTHVTVATVGLGGTVLARELMPLATERNSPADVVELVCAALARVQAAGGAAARIAGIGVSVPGTVDRRTGHVGVAPNLGWRDAELGALLTKALPPGLPVAVGNDADLALLAEHRRGSARDCDDVVYLMGRVGVGAGIIVNGAPLRGRDGHAGEIGHNVVDASGPPCHCGKRGCVETYVGEGALLSLAGAPLPPNDETVAAVFAAAHDGRGAALRAVRRLAERLGRTLATLVNTVNPDRVLLGGSFTEVLRLARPELESAVGRYAFEGSAGVPELLEPAFASDSALLGAAEVAFSGLLADPLTAAARLG